MRDNTNFINTFSGKLHEQRIAFKRKETYDSCVFGRVGYKSEKNQIRNANPNKPSDPGKSQDCEKGAKSMT